MNLRPGQCDIKTISLSNHTKDSVYDKSKGILNQIQSIDIYESIFTPFITADVNLIDGASMKESMNLCGGEDFSIQFLGYGNDDPLTYNFKLTEIGGAIVADNLRSKTLTLRMYSDEYLMSSAKTVSKSYNTSTDLIIKDIIGNIIGSKKKIFVEPTKDLPVTVIPYLSPFTAISLVRQRVSSTVDTGSPLLFFENQKGFFFTTVHSILHKNGAGASDVQTFFQKEGISSNVKGSQGSISDINAHKLFANYTVKTPVNAQFLLERGGVNTAISEFDLNTKTFRKRVFTNSTSNDTDPIDGKKSLLTETLLNEYGKFVNKPLLVPFARYKDNNNRTQNYVYETFAEKYSYTSLLTQQKTYIDIPGNTKIMAGSIVQLNVPRHDSSFDNKDKNEYDSGRYMVSSVRHSISNLADSKYDTHLELLRYGRGVFTK